MIRGGLGFRGSRDTGKVGFRADELSHMINSAGAGHIAPIRQARQGLLPDRGCEQLALGTI